MLKQAAVMLSAVAVIGHASVENPNVLVGFKGGIGVTPVLNVSGTLISEGVFPNVAQNIVRGVPPAGPWRIADLRATVTTSGEIKVRGRGLLLAAGNRIGQNANQSVFATLICEAAPLRRAQHDLDGCSARIEWRFSHRRHADACAVGMRQPGAADCSSNLNPQVWFAAGIPLLGDDED